MKCRSRATRPRNEYELEPVESHLDSGVNLNELAIRFINVAGRIVVDWSDIGGRQGLSIDT